ncbi:hypothetical protein NLU13_1065 [Sarocladium strictum]|uniref:Increased loss of mitochondrial DNA protein 1 n=1 Tax=Sarocladium strictum TaxID=5046 RepID=A0AA39LC08_SARSR|nr:hypothetical protein NLU13_1065 [Sarocladium strictum]
MGLITANTIITSVSLFHLTLAFFFLTNPKTVDDQALVFFLGESMGVPYARGFDTPSAPLGLLSAVLALLGISDLVSLSMPEEIGMIYYWGPQAPLRSLFSTALLLYTFLSGPSSSIFTPPSTRHFSRDPTSMGGTGSGGALRNRVFFTFMFFETISWFWVWVTLREERNALIDKLKKTRQAQRD